MRSTVRSILRHSPLAVVVACIVSAACPGALAFDSYPPGAPHDQITGDAAKQQGFNSATTDKLKEAVRQPDWDESSWKHWKTFGPNSKYMAKHHFDRGPGVSDKDAFTAGAGYVSEQKMDALKKARMGDNTGAISALGRALHALEDLKAHSNFVDLSPAEQMQVENAAMDPSMMPPMSLKLTGYDPGAADPEHPPGDNYSHGDHAKDNATKNADAKMKDASGKSNYDKAKEAATAEAESLIAMLKDSLTTAQQMGLMNAYTYTQIGDPGFGPRMWIITPTACSSGGFTANGTVATVTFPAGVFSSRDTVYALSVPNSLFYTPDQTMAADGAMTTAWIEIQVSNVDQVWGKYPRAGTATFLSPDSNFIGLNTARLATYFFNPDSARWLQVRGATLQHSADGWTATFPLAAGGAYGIGAPMTMTPDKMHTIELSSIAPNPFRSAVQIDFRVMQDMPVTVDVFDVHGRTVRTLMQSMMPVGVYSETWDGIDDAGNTVPRGVYIVRLTAGDEAVSGHLLRMR